MYNLVPTVDTLYASVSSTNEPKQIVSSWTCTRITRFHENDSLRRVASVVMVVAMVVVMVVARYRSSSSSLRVTHRLFSSADI